MNLHILTDSSISATFYRNLRDLGLLGNNKVVVRDRKEKTKHMGDLPTFPMYSKGFDGAVGDTGSYDKVFIHQFSPLMYRWVAKNSFKQLNWMIWGADLYNLPGIDFDFYEPLTRKYMRKVFPLDRFLFHAKVFLTNSYYKSKAYSKIDHVLTWMKSEYAFAKNHLPALRADQQFFFYVNDKPYSELVNLVRHDANAGKRPKRKLIIGNSGTPTNNHLDCIARLEREKIQADLVLPVSYGDPDYIRYIKANLPSYTGGTISFHEQFMPFEEYLNFLMDSDGLIMNNIRPQGYGNILMMLYLGKAVYLNEKNMSTSDLAQFGIVTSNWSDLSHTVIPPQSNSNKDAIDRLLSHDRLGEVYLDLFSE